MLIETLTELEGAVLTEVEYRGNRTAFRVRRAFEQSGSANWRGSAGAVYAAIKRLTARKLIEGQPIENRRGGSELAVTPIGRASLNAWALDVGRAADSGFDPFRLRAGMWLTLPDAEQQRHMRALEEAVHCEIRRLEIYAQGQDEIEQVEVVLAIELQKQRLTWIANQRMPLTGAVRSR